MFTSSQWSTQRCREPAITRRPLGLGSRFASMKRKFSTITFDTPLMQTTIIVMVTAAPRPSRLLVRRDAQLLFKAMVPETANLIHSGCGSVAPFRRLPGLASARVVAQ